MEGEPGHRNYTYLVSLVVELCIVFEHLGPLLVVEGAHQLIDSNVGVRAPPLFGVLEPISRQLPPLHPLCPYRLTSSSNSRR